MKFGMMNLFPLAEGNGDRSVFEETLEEIQLAEELGFDSVWLAEHHFSPYGLLGNPLIFAAAVAQRTKRIRIGTAVMVIPFYDPIRLAEDAALVDIISGGRFMLGAGRGYQPIEFAGFGVNPEEARSRYKESMDIVKLAWTQERFSYQGQHYQINDLAVYPKPYQKPHPPILQAAVSPETFRLAGKQGQPILTAPTFTPMMLVKNNFDLYRQELAAAGHDVAGFDMPLQNQVFISDDPAELQAAAQASLNYYRHLGTLLPGGDKPASEQYAFYSKVQQNIDMLTLDQVLSRGGNFGSAEQVVERLRFLEDEVGVNHYIGWFRYGTLERKKAIRSMELFAEKVMPALRTENESAVR